MKKSIGYISYTHGLDGKVKLVPMINIDEIKNILNSKRVIYYDAESDKEISIKMDIFAFNGKIFICKIDGVNIIDDAKQFLKKEVYIKCEDNDFIDAELLIGYNVFSFSDNDLMLGKVVDCGDYGAGMLIEVEKIDNKNNKISKKNESEFYLCNRETIISIDKKNKSIIIKDYNS